MNDDGRDENSSSLSSWSSHQKRPPKFSDAFKRHMEQVINTFENNPYIGAAEGVDCTGEPSVDPSRMVMDNGLDSEYLSDFVENCVQEKERKHDDNVSMDA